MAQETTAVRSLRRWGVSVDGDLLYRTLVLMGPRSSAGAARELGVTEAVVRVDVPEKLPRRLSISESPSLGVCFRGESVQHEGRWVDSI